MGHKQFFAGWKRYPKVYHLIAKSEYGLMGRIFDGLIIYLLLPIHCHEQNNERATAKRVRKLRI